MLISKVREYIECKYKGDLIGISDLANYCSILEGELYKILIIMESNNELKIIKKYFNSIDSLGVKVYIDPLV